MRLAEEGHERPVAAIAKQVNHNTIVWRPLGLADLPDA